MQATRLILGAHQSIVGGYHRAVERARQATCDCVQLFTKNNSQWRAKAIVAEDVARFQASLAQRNISHPLAHGSYLVNLATPKPDLWQRSRDALVLELQRAWALGIPYLVIHPGSFRDSSPKAGLRRIVRGLDQVHRETMGIGTQILLETTAGQGTCLGWQFEHLAAILGSVREPVRVHVCFDTCHVFAAGYPLSPRKEYEATLAEFDRIVGLDQIKAFHLNDSRSPCGARVDRHHHM